MVRTISNPHHDVVRTISNPHHNVVRTISNPHHIVVRIRPSFFKMLFTLSSFFIHGPTNYTWWIFDLVWWWIELTWSLGVSWLSPLWLQHLSHVWQARVFHGIESQIRTDGQTRHFLEYDWHRQMKLKATSEDIIWKGIIMTVQCSVWGMFSPSTCFLSKPARPQQVRLSPH